MLLRPKRPSGLRAACWLWIAAAALFCAPARADVWGYIDARGVAHFAAERLDDRYEIFFREGQSFNTKDGVPVKETAVVSVVEYARPIAVPAVPSKLLAFFEISANYKAVRHLVREAASTYNLDYELLKALITTESGFDAQAISPKGAVGLMQLMPPTAARYGVRADAKSTIEKKLFDPKTNIGAGARYFRDLVNLFPGNLELALAAYNAGEGAVQRAGNRIPNYPETQNYVKTVSQLYRALKPPTVVVERREEREVQKLPTRVRLEQIGGASGRGNMVQPLGTPVGVPVLPSVRAGADAASAPALTPTAANPSPAGVTRASGE